MKNLFIIAFLCFLPSISSAQNNAQLAGLTFEQYDKTESTTIVRFTSNTQATYIMSGTLMMSGKTFRDECPCKCNISGNKVKITCNCPDKEIYPEPIVESYIYDAKAKTLTSTNFKYTSGSAPTSDLVMKYMIWTQK